MAKKVLVTGANKGIGLAVAKGLLEKGCFVYFGARDAERGAAALKQIVEAEPKYAPMAQLMLLDVSDDASVAAAAAAIKEKGPLDGLINNAGIADGGFEFTSKEVHNRVVDVNFFGAVRVTQAMLPLMAEDGRIVMMSSGAAPMFVAKCSSEKQKFFCNPDIALEDIKAALEECKAIAEGAPDAGAATTAFQTAGYGPGGSYGLSKAALNSYAMALARANPKLKINACSPGFVETDLTRPYAVKYGKTAQEMGMISPEKGAQSSLFLMLGDVPTPSGKAYYYGSDSLRSPLHILRNPGDPAYEGE
uniref:FabG domain-containing protein n=2 Tax=Eukaryota TaxID=2759 RepID=X5CX02_9EUKA